MKKNIFKALMFFLFLGLVLNKNASSWTEETHANLSEYAGENSVLSKDKGDYLKNLGFDNDLDEYLRWGNDIKKLRKWLAEGAKLEDAGSLSQMAVGNGRSFNHFHNPIKQFPWTDAGLDDWIVLPPFHTTGQSSLLWAQDETNQENFPEGNWSWRKIREHYYAALTGKDFNGNVVAPDEAMRKEYFARTFRGLGHQMHLIQDAAQPDHVRNDAHIESEELL